MSELISKFEKYASTMNSKPEQTSVLNAMKSALNSWEVPFNIASKLKNPMLAARLCAAAHAVAE